jgi:hypothetical protein
MQPQQVLSGPFFDQRLEKGVTIFYKLDPCANFDSKIKSHGFSEKWVCDDSPKNVEKFNILYILGIISNIQMNVARGLAYRPPGGWPIGHPGVGHPKGVFGVFSYYKIVTVELLLEVI